MELNKLKSSPVPAAEILGVLREFNPWWDRRAATDVPSWRRAAFAELHQWLVEPPAARAVMLSGPRQVGKTTLIRQAATTLVASGVNPRQLVYATFDHPILKLAGIESTLEVWRDHLAPEGAREYVLLDEVQSVKGWDTWLKHQVDFNKQRRIAVTGSALPLAKHTQESGVGRWHTIKLPTLSFWEYVQLRRIDAPELPAVGSLAQLFKWAPREFALAGERARGLMPHFHEYLLRGGFPQTALADTVATAQKLLREDIVDKVLKRDMTALFGVRRILELERLFVYLCLHDGGILDVAKVSSGLELSKSIINESLDRLEACNLIYRLSPYGYGSEVLRGKHKVYLIDPAISGSVLIKGVSLLEDPTKLGAAVETAFYKHVFTRYYAQNPAFAYWRGKGKPPLEVDVVATLLGQVVPFEVKYAQGGITSGDTRGLAQLADAMDVARGYIITRDMGDFGPLTDSGAGARWNRTEQVMRIPAALACWWLGSPVAPSASQD